MTGPAAAPPPASTPPGSSPWRTEVEWVLPGATLTVVEDLADPRWPAGAKRGQLVAIVTDDDRLTAQIAYPRSKRVGPRLKARLLPDDRGLVIRGHLPRDDVINVAMWVGFCAVLIMVALVGSAGDGPLLLAGLAFAGCFAALTPNVWRHASSNQRDEVEKLQAALLERFAADD